MHFVTSALVLLCLTLARAHEEPRCLSELESCNCKCNCKPVIKIKRPKPKDNDVFRYCPEPFNPIVGMCFKYYEGGRVPGSDACDTCMDEIYGSYALSFIHYKEVQWMATPFKMVHPDKYVWTSGAYHNGTWMWMGTGMKFSLSDYFWVKEPSPGDCVMVDVDMRKLTSGDCNYKAALVCQKDVMV